MDSDNSFNRNFSIRPIIHHKFLIFYKEVNLFTFILYGVIKPGPPETFPSRKASRNGAKGISCASHAMCSNNNIIPPHLWGFLQCVYLLQQLSLSKY